MENEASKTRSLDMAFVADAELLKRLDVVLSEVADKREYTVKFSDGVGRQNVARYSCFLHGVGLRFGLQADSSVGGRCSQRTWTGPGCAWVVIQE